MVGRQRCKLDVRVIISMDSMMVMCNANVNIEYDRRRSAWLSSALCTRAF